MNATINTGFCPPCPRSSLQRMDSINTMEYLNGYMAMIIFIMGLIATYIQIIIHKNGSSVLKLIKNRNQNNLLVGEESVVVIE